MSRILIADDHELLRDVLKTYLELDSDFDVKTVSDLPDALDAIRSEPDFDLVVLDLRMPGMDGLAGLDDVLRLNRGGPVAVMSGMAPADAPVRIAQAGGAGFIPKTLPAKDMVKAFKRMLAGERYFSDSIAKQELPAASDEASFSPREKLRNALKSDEFYLVYQPIVNLTTKRWVGAEALMRWRQADGTEVSPDCFVPLAASEGYAAALTEKLLVLLERDAKGIFDLCPDFILSLNVFGSEISDQRFVSRLTELVAVTGAEPTNFAVEIIEQGMIEGLRAKQSINDLNALGFRVCIDDFGRGSSNLSYIIDYDFHCLKIDRSFIANILTSEFERRLLEHMISIASDFNFTIVCEGVEEQSQADYLQSLGVELVQGWLYSKAKPLKELLADMPFHVEKGGSAAILWQTTKP